MAEPNGYVVRSLEATHYREALAQHAMEVETFEETHGVRSQPGNIRRITILSDQNLDWDIMLFRSRPEAVLTDLDALEPCGIVNFTVADGVRIAGAGPYIYVKDDINIRYAAKLGRAEMYVGLINRNAAAKSAGDAGSVVVEIELTVAGEELPVQSPIVPRV
jgi:hypothetical protein